MEEVESNEIEEQRSATESTISERKHRKRLIAVTVANYQEFISGLVQSSLASGEKFARLSSIFRNVDSLINTALMIILAFTSGSGILFMLTTANWSVWSEWLPQLILVLLVTFSAVIQSIQRGFNIGARGQNFDQISLKYSNFAREQSLVLLNMPIMTAAAQREAAIKAESSISEIELITSPV